MAHKDQTEALVLKRRFHHEKTAASKATANSDSIVILQE